MLKPLLQRTKYRTYTSAILLFVTCCAVLNITAVPPEASLIHGNLDRNENRFTYERSFRLISDAKDLNVPEQLGMHFRFLAGACLLAFNDILPGCASPVTLAECMEKCLSDDKCLSFDHKRKGQSMCCLSTKTMKSSPEMFSDSCSGIGGWTYYEKLTSADLPAVTGYDPSVVSQGSNSGGKSVAASKSDGGANNGTSSKISKVPHCDTYLDEQSDTRFKMMILASYEPGYCKDVVENSLHIPCDITSEVPDTSTLCYPLLEEACEKLPKDKDWLCRNIESPKRIGHAFQRYDYGSLRDAAIEELGKECYDINLNIHFSPGTLNQQGGERKVTSNLFSGLRLIGKRYSVFGRKFHEFDLTYIPQRFLVPLYDAKYLGGSHPATFMVGPNVNTELVHFDKILSHHRVHFIGASKSQAFASLLKSILRNDHTFNNTVTKFREGSHRKTRSRGITVSWLPTPVDTLQFPKTAYKENSLALLIEKYMSIPELETLLEARGIRIETFEYGNYLEDDFRKTLAKANFAIVVSGPEAQGIANQEIMAANIPLFVSKTTIGSAVPFWDNRVGTIFDPDKKLGLQLDRFLEKVDRGVFVPREFIEENLSLYRGTVEWLSVACRVAEIPIKVKHKPKYPVEVDIVDMHSSV